MYETKEYFYGTGRRKHSVARVRVYNGTGKARVNGRVVRIGYLAQGKAATLCEQLAAVLRDESGVAN